MADLRPERPASPASDTAATDDDDSPQSSTSTSGAFQGGEQRPKPADEEVRAGASGRRAGRVGKRGWRRLQVMSQYLRVVQQLDPTRAAARLKAQQETLAAANEKVWRAWPYDAIIMM